MVIDGDYWLGNGGLNTHKQGFNGIEWKYMEIHMGDYGTYHRITFEHEHLTHRFYLKRWAIMGHTLQA